MNNQLSQSEIALNGDDKVIDCKTFIAVNCIQNDPLDLKSYICDKISQKEVSKIKVDSSPEINDMVKKEDEFIANLPYTDIIVNSVENVNNINLEFSSYKVCNDTLNSKFKIETDNNIKIEFDDEQLCK